MISKKDDFYRYAAKVELLKRGRLDVVLYNIETDIQKRHLYFGTDRGRNKNTDIN